MRGLCAEGGGTLLISFFHSFLIIFMEYGERGLYLIAYGYLAFAFILYTLLTHDMWHVTWRSLFCIMHFNIDRYVPHTPYYTI